ncbi:tRNA pseudouridine(13) synthase TruD [Candidatus Micrarchaeota archaeon]|nr:tRNA pseudouridine(13) synthase TruD [Candidatus Micrarchaeota archaeon]
MNILEKIKENPENFIVEEITKHGEILELDKTIEKEDNGGGFTWFVLQKKDWNTDGAVRRIARALRISQRRFNYAGTKDKKALTTQLVSVIGNLKIELLELKLQDISINGAWLENRKIGLGELLGNCFTLNPSFSYSINEISEFPNFFGAQRFGFRKNNHVVGKHIIKTELESAVKEFLLTSSEREKSEVREARQKLSEDWDPSAALAYFPGFMHMERVLLHSLKENPADYAGALRKLPRGNLLMFLHSYQSYLFNILLEKHGKKLMVATCGKNEFGFPSVEKQGKEFFLGNLIGYETELIQEEKEILEKEGITQEDFMVGSMPELNLKGGKRLLYAPLINREKLRFSLPSGCYASIAVQHLILEKKE